MRRLLVPLLVSALVAAHAQLMSAACRCPKSTGTGRAAERAIAALEACCDHGGEATTMCICKSISNSKGVIFRLRAAGRTAEIV